MSDQAKKAQAVDTILYTTESASSRRRTEDDLKVDDPTPEQAVAVLTGQGGFSPAPNKVAEGHQEKTSESENR